eukprot:1104547-Ditylum_brightwellii.AAC.2
MYGDLSPDVAEAVAILIDTVQVLYVRPAPHPNQRLVRLWHDSKQDEHMPLCDVSPSHPAV